MKSDQPRSLTSICAVSAETFVTSRELSKSVLMEVAPPSAGLTALRAVPLLVLGYAARFALSTLYRAA